VAFTGTSEAALLQRQISELQARIASLEDGQNLGARNVRASRGNMPQVTGLSVDQGVGALRIMFDPVAISDLRQYEVQIDNSRSFSSPIVLTTSGTSLVHNPGTDVGTTTYYVRVRAVSISRGTGPWTSTIDQTPGQAGADDLATNSVTTVKILEGAITTSRVDIAGTTELATFTKSSGFTLLSAAGTATEVYGPVEVTIFDGDSIIIPNLIFELDYDSSFADSAGSNNLTADLLRRPAGGMDSTIDSARTDFKSTIPTLAGTARTVLAAFSEFDAPGPGDFEYRFKITVASTSTNTLTIQGVNLTLQFLQYKR
jgi:hypothetical protein